MTSWVLVVASDARRQRFLREELEDAGYAVEVATTAEAALQWLAVIRPALIVADDGVAGLDQLQLACRVGPAEPDSAIPLVTVAGALARC
jgi:DNA-binding response OmpR family regulator